MISKEELEKRIIGLIAEWSRHPVGRLSSATLINSWRHGGLAIDGTDAYELIGFITQRIGWEAKTLEYDDFFGPELGWNPITLISMIIKGNWKKLSPLTIGLLSEKFFESQPS